MTFIVVLLPYVSSPPTVFSTDVRRCVAIADVVLPVASVEEMIEAEMQTINSYIPDTGKIAN